MEELKTQPLQRIVTKIDANPELIKRNKSNGPLNVAAYCRVSTDAEDQINSYKAQVAYYTEHITQNPKWRFVDIYADEGITGTMVAKRDNFMRMIKDCEKGKIDLILTKSVSRFARNVVDSLSYIRKLKAMNIGIYFEEQNINSLEEESETYIGIYSVIAQSESENISSNVKWGITKRMQNGTYACRFNFLGYRKDKGESEPHIIPEEAKIVRHIFKMYLEGSSIDQIKQYLENNHIKTVQGKDFWKKTVIRHMLQNEKYVGDVLYQKTFTTDCISKRTKINHGEKAKYLVSNNHPAIIDRETFKAVQAEMVRRSNKRKTSDFAITNLGKYSGKYALSELLICGECGSFYKRKTWTKGTEKRIYWRCQSRIEHGSKYCKKSKGIEEKKLHDAICRALRKMVEEKESIVCLIKADLAYGLSGEELTYDVGALETSISNATLDLEDYMKQYSKTGGDKEKYFECIRQTSEKIKLLRSELDIAKAKVSENKIISDEVERLTRWLTENDVSFESYDDIVVRRMVEMIRVNGDNTITVFSKFGKEVVVSL